MTARPDLSPAPTDSAIEQRFRERCLQRAAFCQALADLDGTVERQGALHALARSYRALAGAPGIEAEETSGHGSAQASATEEATGRSSRRLGGAVEAAAGRG